MRAATPSLRRLRVVIDASRGLIRACLQLVSAGARRVAQRLDFSLSQWIAPTAYGWRQTPSTRHAGYARERKQRFTDENLLELAALRDQHRQLRLIIRTGLDGLDLVHDHHRDGVEHLAEDDVFSI